MHVISYVSDALIDTDRLQPEISNLVTAAQKKNAREGVTGVLFFENDHFFQTIEGEESELRRLYSTIERDKRHWHIRKLVDQPIVTRAFPDWSLDTFYVDTPELINPQTLQMLQALYFHNFGVDTAGLIDFVKKMIDEMDTFKILNPPHDA